MIPVTTNAVKEPVQPINMLKVLLRNIKSSEPSFQRENYIFVPFKNGRPEMKSMDNSSTSNLEQQLAEVGLQEGFVSILLH